MNLSRFKLVKYNPSLPIPSNKRATQSNKDNEITTKQRRLIATDPSKDETAEMKCHLKSIIELDCANDTPEDEATANVKDGVMIDVARSNVVTGSNQSDEENISKDGATHTYGIATRYMHPYNYVISVDR